MDRQDQYKPIYSQHRCKDTIKNYTIIGERHSGTNWLENILSSRLSCDLTWDCGSKHFINPNPNKLAQSNNTLFVCITRNIYDWLGGFFRLPHHVDRSITSSLNDFLLKEWKCEIYDNDYLTNKPYKNIFELRKYKLQYIQIFLPCIVNNLVVTRYEDLCIDPETLVTFISETFSINKTHYKYYKGTLPKLKAPYLFSHNELDIINSNTDWETEKYFNYLPLS